MHVNKRILGWSFGLIAVVSVFTGYLFYPAAAEKKYCIYNYDEARDTDFILKLFKNNWYWLVEEGSTFSAEYMLKHRASSKAPEHLGNETIKVMFAEDKPVGFVSYYPLKFYEGKIHFVAVDEQYRSNGYGVALVKYAIQELIKRGFKKISLVTRVSNIAAQKIYKKAGMQEARRTEKFVYFHYYV